MPDEGPCSNGESIQELATENVMAAAIRRTVFQPQQPAKIQPPVAAAESSGSQCAAKRISRR
jgi:hypothetical protein